MKGLYQIGSQNHVRRALSMTMKLSLHQMISRCAVGLPNHINIYLCMLQILYMFHVRFLDKDGESSVCLFRYTLSIVYSYSTN